jgi:hypothetical protein
MPTQYRDEARPARVARRVAAANEETTAHPLLDLQQHAGNAAVAQLVGLQRHTLDPEQEAGD